MEPTAWSCCAESDAVGKVCGVEIRCNSVPVLGKREGRTDQQIYDLADQNREWKSSFVHNASADMKIDDREADFLSAYTVSQG